MANHFFALDVETANANVASICQIGLVEFDDEQVVSSWGTLVNPKTYFDPINISIHGITPEAVASAPVFADVYPHLLEKTAGKVVVTHTSFDQASLRRAHLANDLAEITCTWLDSARVARRQWEQFRQSGYGLSNLAEFFEINYKAHDAVEDARAAGELLVRAMQESSQSIDEWLERAYQRITPSGGFTREGNPDGPLYGETVVFTGALSMVRSKAVELAAQAGCGVADSVNKKVTLLVVGDQDIRHLAGQEKSSKHRRAEELIGQGQSIRILGESDFCAVIGVEYVPAPKKPERPVDPYKGIEMNISINVRDLLDGKYDE